MAELNIVIKDEGPAAASTPAAPPAHLADTLPAPLGPPARPRSTGPKADDSGSRWRGAPAPSDDKPRAPKEKPGPTLSDDLTKAGKTAADALGMGGLAGTTKSLTDAFWRLYQAVAAQGGRASTPDMGGPRLAETKTPIGAPAPSMGLGRTTSGIGGTGLQGAKAFQASQITGAFAGGGGASGASGLAAVAAAAGPVAIALAAATAAAVGFGMVVKRVSDGLHAEALRLSNFSPDLAGATARSDLRAELADMRRANRIGPQLARFEDTRSQFNTKLADAQTKVLEAVLELVNKFEPLIDLGGDTVTVLAKHLPEITALVKILSPAAQAIELTSDNAEAIARMLRKLLRIAEERPEDDAAADPFLHGWLNGFAGPPLPRMAPLPAMPAPGMPGGGAHGP